MKLTIEQIQFAASILEPSKGEFIVEQRDHLKGAPVAFRLRGTNKFWVSPEIYACLLDKDTFRQTLKTLRYIEIEDILSYKIPPVVFEYPKEDCSPKLGFRLWA